MPPALPSSPGTHCAVVSYALLTEATNNWAESLGSGSYGAVYAGVLHGERVAVKRFRQKENGTDSFLREVAVAALVQHPHVLRVVAMVRGPDPSTWLLVCLARGAAAMGASGRSLDCGSSGVPWLSCPAPTRTPRAQPCLFSRQRAFTSSE